MYNKELLRFHTRQYLGQVFNQVIDQAVKDVWAIVKTEDREQINRQILDLIYGHIRKGIFI